MGKVRDKGGGGQRVQTFFLNKNLVIYAFLKDCNALMLLCSHFSVNSTATRNLTRKKVVVVFHEAKMKNYANNLEYFTSESL